MNAQHKMPANSDAWRVSHYGAHTSLLTADRVEIVDLLQDTLCSALTILGQVKLGQLKLRNVSFIAVQQLFHRLSKANLDYIEFLTQRIDDLGGYSESTALMSALYSVNEQPESQRFALCIQIIHQGASQLCVHNVKLREYRDHAFGSKDHASTRFFEECMRHTARFASLIQDNLPHGTAHERQPPHEQTAHS